MLLSGALGMALIVGAIILIRKIITGFGSIVSALKANTAALQEHSKELAAFAIVMKGVSGFSDGSLRLAEAQIKSTTRLEDSISGLRDEMRILSGAAPAPDQRTRQRVKPPVPDFSEYDPEKAQHQNDIAELIRNGMSLEQAEHTVGDPAYLTELDEIRAAR